MRKNKYKLYCKLFLIFTISFNKSKTIFNSIFFNLLIWWAMFSCSPSPDSYSLLSPSSTGFPYLLG